MTKKSTDTLIAFLDIMQGDPIYANASRALNLHETTVFRWIKESRRASEHPEQPSEFYFEYAGETKWFWQHMRDAISASVERIEQAARSRAEKGHYTRSFFQGRTVWRVDPELEELDPDVREILTGHRNCLLRDENGQPVPELVWHSPSTDLVAMILAAHSKRYRRQSQVNVDVNNRLSGGVMLLNGGNAPQAKSVTHQPVLPLVEILESAEPGPVAHASEPDADADAEDVATEEQADAEDVAAVAPAPPPPPRPTRELTPLQRDLISRAQMRLDDPARSAPVGVNK